MADDAFVFNRATAREIVESVRKLQRQVREITGSGLLRTFPDTGALFLAKTGEEPIAAMTEDTGTYTPGSGQVELYKINADGELQRTRRMVTAYNIASSEVASDTFIQLKRERISGRLIIDFEDCGA